MKKFPSLNTLSQLMDCKVKIQIDGNFAYLAWLSLLSMGITINWKSLFQYILNFIREKNPNVNPILDKSISYMFMGDAPWVDDQRERFRHELLMEGIDCKRKPLKKVDNRISDGSKGWKEQGIDALNIAHAFYDAFVGAGANSIPTAQYSYLVMFAGDSDFASTFDLLHTLGIKIIVVYFDNDKIHTSDLIINQADYAIPMESLRYDRRNSLAQSIFEPVHSATNNTKFSKTVATLQFQSPAFDNGTGTVKFIDAYSNSWGVIEGSNGDGDYYFSISDVKSSISLTKGNKVQFKVLKRPLPNDGSQPKCATNGKATDITVIATEERVLQEPTIYSERISQAAKAVKQVSECELKQLVKACSTRENGFALLAEVGAAFKFKFGKPERPLKEILADYPATFEFCNTPAASVRVNG